MISRKTFQTEEQKQNVTFQSEQKTDSVMMPGIGEEISGQFAPLQQSPLEQVTGKNVSLDQQIEQVMAPAMAQDQALDLAAKQKEVQARTEVEQNMPQSHVSISGAMQKLQQREYNRGKDSDEMKLVKEKTGDLLRFLQDKVISPCPEEEFGENLKDVQRSYDEVICACKLYIRQAGHTFTKKGTNRLNVVKGIMLQAETERGFLTDSAMRLRKGQSENDHKILTFEDVIGNMTATEEGAAEGELIERDKASEKVVLASRLADLFGAKGTVPEADLKTCRTKEGLKQLVCVKQQEPQGELSEEEKEKRANTGNIIKALVHGYSSKDMRALLTDIQRSSQKADRDVLNTILTTGLDDMILSFGSLYDKNTAKELEKSLKVFREELKKSGLAEELELYDAKSATDVVVSAFTKEEKQKQTETFKVKEEEQDGLLKEGIDEEKEHIIDYTKTEPKLRTIHRRTGEWKDAKAEPLFGKDINVSEITQGNIGDCYLIAAIATIAKSQPDFLKEMMRDNKDGTVTVRLFQYNADADPIFSPVYVKVNKTIPVRKDGTNYYGGGSLWVQMLEKAYLCSGICRSSLDWKTDSIHVALSLSRDLRDPVTRKQLKEFKANASTKQIREGKAELEKESYDTLAEGGQTPIALQLLTGQYMKHTDTLRSKYYWSDSGFALADDEMEAHRKEDLDHKAKYRYAANAGFLKKDVNAYIRGMMKRHDEEKADGSKEKDPKAKTKTTKKRSNLMEATKEERILGSYYLYTGKKIPAEKENDKETLKTLSVCTEFVGNFIKYMDEKVNLGTKNLKPIDRLMGRLKEFTASFLKTAKNGALKTLRKQFVESDDYVKVIKWLKNTFKLPKNANDARYTRYSGNYYGDVLKLYNDIKESTDKKKYVTTSTDEYRGSLMHAKDTNANGEKGQNGLVFGHAYTITGVAERSFGGKTYKFVIMRNPWGRMGKEYFYNPQKKSLDSRSVSNPNATGGYTMLELSDYAMIAVDHTAQVDQENKEEKGT